MILFPYARDIVYRDKELSFTLDFVGKDNSTSIEIKMGLDDDISSLIEELMEKNDV